MFHTYKFESSHFQEWLKAADRLHFQRYLDLGNKEANYLSLLIDPYPHDHYILCIDDKVGVCGCAILTPLPCALKTSDQHLPQGTWVPRHVLFHIKQGHPVEQNSPHFSEMIKYFYLSLFEHLWQAAQVFSNNLALRMSSEGQDHEGLQFFKGFDLRDIVSSDQTLTLPDDGCFSVLLLSVPRASL